MNTTTGAAFIPELWGAEGLDKLGTYVTFPKIVTRNWESDFAKMGDTVNVRKPLSYTVRKKTSGGSVTQENPTAATVAVVLNQHAYVQVEPEDVVRALAQPELMAQIVRDVMVDMASQIDADAVTEAANFTGTAIGTQGTAADEDDLVDANAVLVAAKMPKSDYASLVIGARTKADLLKRDLFQQANTAGTDETLRTGRIGQAFGFDIYVDQNIDKTGATPGDKNLYFHRSALTLAVRPLPLPESVPSTIVSDPETGLGIRVTKQWNEAKLGESVTFDCLYGYKAVRPELGGYLYGAN